MMRCLPDLFLPAGEGAPRQPSTHLTPPLQHPGSSQATRCWRSTGCHCLGGTPTHISAPQRRAPSHLEGTGDEGTAGAAAAMAPGHRRWAAPSASSPQPLAVPSAPRAACSPGPLHTQHPVWAHRPQPPQSWAVLTGLGATQGTKGSRNPPLRRLPLLQPPGAHGSRLVQTHQNGLSASRSGCGRQRDTQAALADAAGKDGGTHSASVPVGSGAWQGLLRQRSHSCPSL